MSNKESIKRTQIMFKNIVKRLSSIVLIIMLEFTTLAPTYSFVFAQELTPTSPVILGSETTPESSPTPTSTNTPSPEVSPTVPPTTTEQPTATPQISPIVTSITPTPTPFVIPSGVEGSLANASITPTPTTIQLPSPTEIINKLKDIIATPTGELLENPTASPTALPEPSLIPSGTSGNSAILRLPIKLHEFTKNNFRSTESIQLEVDNTDNNNIVFEVVTDNGEKINVNVQKEISESGTQFKILPPQSLTPGKYILKVTDQTGKIETQDFTWGLLAINTNKSIYNPNETASIFLSMVNPDGTVECDGNLTLKIQSEKAGVDEELSTDNGKIKRNANCNVKNTQSTSDYETEFQLKTEGTYILDLKAVKDNKNYETSSYIMVKNDEPLTIERTVSTHLSPKRTTPVYIDIIANKDFQGQIEDIVPESFDVGFLDNAEKYIDIKTINQGEYANVNLNKLGTPFDGNYLKTLGFNEQPDDPNLEKEYKKLGLIGHDGIDYDVPIGTTVKSIDKGIVELANDDSYGNTIVIKHSWGKSYYGHLSEFMVKKGDEIQKGSIIGLSGNSGFTTAPHLHLSISLNNSNVQNGFFGKIDPEPFLNPKLTAQLNVKKLTWDVNLKKGEKITLGYNFITPSQNPQSYLVGLLKKSISEDTNTVLFQLTVYKNKNSIVKNETKRNLKKISLKKRQFSLKEKDNQRINLNKEETPEFNLDMSQNKFKEYFNKNNDRYKRALSIKVTHDVLPNEEIPTTINIDETKKELVVNPDISNLSRPGLYHIIMEVPTSNGIEIVKQDFTWGVLAINTNKSIYLPGDEVYLQMGSLDSLGHTLCDSNLTLEITDPLGNKMNPTITQSPTCDQNNVTDNPDYYSYYQISQAVGIYNITFTNNDTKFSVNDSFEVKNSVPFIVERIGATRINPFKSDYKMTLKIKANQDFTGQIIEQIPLTYGITDSQGGTLTTGEYSKNLTWNSTLVKGEEKTIWYEYNPEEISPYLFTLGPLQVTDTSGQTLFTESRKWQIASDLTCNSAGDLNWNAGASWSCGRVPQSTDDVYILTTHTITVNMTGAVANTLTINSPGANLSTNGLTVSTGQDLSVSGNITYITNTSTSNENQIIQLNGSGNLSAGGNFTIPAPSSTGNSSSLFTFANTPTGNLNVTGSISIASGNATGQTTTVTGAAGHFSANGITITGGTTGVCTMNLTTGTITTTNGITFGGTSGNARLTTTSTGRIDLQGTLSAGGTVAINAGTTIYTTGTSAININASAGYGNITISSGTLALGAAITVAGNWTNNSGSSALSGNYRVTFSGASKTIGGSASTTFYQLTLSNGATVQLNTSGTISNNFTITGTSTNTTFTQSGTTLTLDGTVTINQPTSGTSITSKWAINNGTATVTGAITMVNTNVTYIDNITITTGTLNANGGIGTSTGTGNNTAACHVITMTGSTGTLNLKGGLTYNGGTAGGSAFTFTMGTSGSNFVYDDTSAQTIYMPGSGAYNNLVIHNTGGATLNAAITAANVTGNVVVGDDSVAAVFKNGGLAITGSAGDSFIVNEAAFFEMSGTSAFPVSFGTFTFDPTSTVRYLQTGDMAAKDYDYGHLEFKSGDAACTFTLPTGTIVIAGNLTVGDGSANVTTVTADTNDPDLDIGGNMTINTSSIFTATSDTTDAAFTIAGNFTNNGTYNDGNGRLVIDGSGTSALIYSANTTFHDLKVVTAGKTIKFDEAQTTIIESGGNFIITGTNCTIGRIFLDSYVNDDQWPITTTGATVSVTYADVEDSAPTNSMTATNSTADNDNNTANWTITAGACGPIDLSGYVYSAEPSTAFNCSTNNLTLSISVDGAAPVTTTCTSSGGTWSKTGVTAGSGSIINVWVSSQASGTIYGEIVYVGDGTTQINVNLWQNTLAVRHDTGSNITNANLSTGLYGTKGQQIYAVSAGVLTVDPNIEFHVVSSDTFAPGNTVNFGGGFHNAGTTTWSTYTANFTGGSGSLAVLGTLNSTSAFYIVNFNDADSTWTIQDPMIVSAADDINTLKITAGIVTLGNGTGDNLNVLGKFTISSGATFQTLSTLAQGDTITVNIADAGTACSNCIVDVSGTMTINKNATLSFNSNTSVQSGVEVADTGILNITGSQDDTSTDTGTVSDATRETYLCANEAWTTDLHNNKTLMMTSGLAKGRIYTITDTIAGDTTNCATGTDDSIQRADNSSATNDPTTVSIANNLATITTSASLIDADNEGVGRAIHNLTDNKWYLIVDSTQNGTADEIKVIGTPDALTGFSDTDIIQISDGIKLGDTFEILDYATVTGETTNHGYIYSKAQSQTNIQYADISQLGNASSCDPGTTNKCGITAVSIDGYTAGESFSMQDSYLHDLVKPLDAKTVTKATISSNYMYNNSGDRGFRFGSSSYNTISNNRLDGTGGFTVGIDLQNGASLNNVIAGNIVYNMSAYSGEAADGSENNVWYNNTIFKGTGAGIHIDITDRNTIVDNLIFHMTNNGISLYAGSPHMVVGNKVINCTSGINVNNNTSNISYIIDNSVGVEQVNTTSDLNYSSSTFQIYGFNNIFGTTTEVNNVPASGAVAALFKHDQTNGLTKIWGQYTIPADTTETTQVDERIQKFNYADNTFPDSFTPHLFKGSGTEGDLGLHFGGSGSMIGSLNHVLYRLTYNGTNWDVYSNETSIGTATTSVEFTDTTTNVHFTITNGSPANGTTYTFFAYKTSGDTSTQKTVTQMQTGGYLQADAGKTLQLLGGSSANQTILNKDAGATSYGLTVTGASAVINANYYKITGTDNNGLNIGTSATVTDLSNGVFDDTGGTVVGNSTYLKVVSGVLNSGARTFTNVTFDETTSTDSNIKYNVTLSGTPSACGNSWTFNSSGNKGGTTNGEANDSDIDGSCSGVGYILWTTYVSGPTTDQQMRHGDWFNSGTKQYFTF